jgi:haloalkane dehalogenase
MTSSFVADGMTKLYPFSPKKVVIGGNSLSYIDEGQGPVIVMLHGNPTWSFFYRRLILALGDRYRIIAPDHLGCGLSDKPQDYSYRLADHMANIEFLLDSLKIREFSLVLHDWGGAIGMGMAGRHPERLRALVVMNTAAFRSKRIPFRIRICRIPLFGDILVRGFNGFARAALHMAVTNPLPKDVAAGYLAPYAGWKNRIAILRFVQDIPLSPKHPSYQTLADIEARLPLLRNIPMLLPWGGRDFCFTRPFYDEWRRRFPNAEGRYFANAGHYLLEDAFDEIAPGIADFFARQLT